MSMGYDKLFSFELSFFFFKVLFNQTIYWWYYKRKKQNKNEVILLLKYIYLDLRSLDICTGKQD